MSTVLVRNNNQYPFTQMFKGEKIEIPAGKAVEMEREEAVEFFGAFYPPKIDYNGNIDPKSFKRLEIVPLSEQVYDVDDSKIVNHATGDVYESQEQYDAAIKSDPELLARQKTANELDVKNVKAKGKSVS